MEGWMEMGTQGGSGVGGHHGGGHGEGSACVGCMSMEVGWLGGVLGLPTGDAWLGVPRRWAPHLTLSHRGHGGAGDGAGCR